MDRLCETPAQGWLWASYDALRDALFPDPARRLLPAEAYRAIDFYLTVLNWFLETERGRLAFDPLEDPPELTAQELADTLIAAEYARFCKVVSAARYVPLMRLGRALERFDAASHSIGVQQIAVQTARKMAAAGQKVDVALVSAAALVHDIGKYGCRGEEAAQMPTLHYKYTNEWLLRHGLPQIAQVATNHATWDLEKPELAPESLALIYADYRVRGRMEAGRERVQIYPLGEAHDMIRQKLLNVTPAKLARYEAAFCRLAAFERSLPDAGAAGA